MISTGGGGDSVFLMRLDWSPILHHVSFSRESTGYNQKGRISCGINYKYWWEKDQSFGLVNLPRCKCIGLRRCVLMLPGRLVAWIAHTACHTKTWLRSCWRWSGHRGKPIGLYIYSTLQALLLIYIPELMTFTRPIITIIGHYYCWHFCLLHGKIFCSVACVNLK